MGILDRLTRKVADGRLRADAGQREAAERLEKLAAEIEAFRPGLFRRSSAPRGLYLWGDVGRGKSMLMDLFFDSVAIESKRRAHFNVFMADVHRLLHAARQQEQVRDPIPLVARQLETRLLCFDELQVEDVADAMIIGRVFEQLLARDCIIVTTSNTPPGRLYENGLNRQLFLPFIALIEERLDVVRIAGEDHRRGFNGENYHVGPDADAAMDAAWNALGGDAEHMRTLSVLGRTLTVARATHAAARFGFAELCETPLAAGDYLALAEAFSTILIDRIPVLTGRDPARRFTVLIDTLYDRNIRLICSAAADPDGLYPGGETWFRRTASRLVEMRSDAYIAKGKT